MSYGLAGNFFVNNKKIAEIGLDKLKILNSTRYSSDFDHIDPISCPEGIERSKEYSSTFYNSNCFRNALGKYEKEYEEIKERVDSLSKIRKSIKYYLLKTEQKEELLQELADYSELLEESEYRVEAVKFMVHTFECLSELKVDDEYWRDEDKIIVEVMVV